MLSSNNTVYFFIQSNMVLFGSAIRYSTQFWKVHSGVARLHSVSSSSFFRRGSEGRTDPVSPVWISNSQDLCRKIPPRPTYERLPPLTLPPPPNTHTHTSHSSEVHGGVDGRSYSVSLWCSHEILRYPEPGELQELIFRGQSYGLQSAVECLS